MSIQWVRPCWISFSTSPWLTAFLLVQNVEPQIKDSFFNIWKILTMWKVLGKRQRGMYRAMRIESWLQVAYNLSGCDCDKFTKKKPKKPHRSQWKALSTWRRKSYTASNWSITKRIFVWKNWKNLQCLIPIYFLLGIVELENTFSKYSPIA